MANAFLEIAITPSVRAAQAANGSAGLYDRIEGKQRRAIAWAQPRLSSSPRETASTSRASPKAGGPMSSIAAARRDFLKVIDEGMLAFADFRGNRQYLTLGNMLPTIASRSSWSIIRVAGG